MLYKHRDVQRKFYNFFFFISALWFIESAVFEVVLEFNSSVLIFVEVFGCRCMWNQVMK